MTKQQTTGELADDQAAARGWPGGPFSYKLDGVVAPRDTPASIVDNAASAELVDVSDYPYPETDKT